MMTLLHLVSAVALLVWGTHIVRTGVLRVYGARLRRLLGGRLNRPLAFAAGTGVTALVQSSNATALLASGFVADRLMPLATALAILLGADLGTAVMARVLTLDLSWLWPLLVIVGVPLFLSRKQSRAGQLGRVAIGLGLILLALELIIDAMAPITEARGVQVLFQSLTGDLMLDAVVGALFAMLTWSSLAAVLLTATLAAAGVLPLPVALALVVGANVGSGLLALMNTSLHNAAGRRVTLGNLLFKLLGLALVLPAVPWLADWLTTLPFDDQDRVIGFHVVYNGARCLLLLPFTGVMARFTTRLMPDSGSDGDAPRPRHLDPAALDRPRLALANATREVLRMGDTVEAMLDAILEALRDERPGPARDLGRQDDELDALYTGIKLYLARVSREQLHDTDQHRWSQVMEMSINLEQAGDQIEHMMEKVRDRKTARRRAFSDSGLRELIDLHGQLHDNLRLGLSVFLDGDPESARQLLIEKDRFRDRQRQLSHAHLERLHRRVVQSIETSSLHLELIGDMKRLNSLFCAVAFSTLEFEEPDGPAFSSPSRRNRP
ncbi:Na/Pi cotransporter family protein [Alloalcanivorax marinus]|uniref:Na/Pi cotransporter family protein n=1 Tax=Alloalcanivorax marinus TaxID=1177169 RepID=UPI001931C40D|nr:Na/Pi cotransporter family protein [Alloalcanivorax marinus]MBL7250630.1 Na/Pi cotransporter family protein [Alloalcanivorax marinus]